jgi:hypothetical protein
MTRSELNATRAPRVLALLMLFPVLLPAGCARFDPGEIAAGNARPETFLSYAPDSGDTTSFRTRMNWYGWDADGEIAGFRVRVDSQDWNVVATNESVLVLPARESPDSTHAYGYHTFTVAAVDDDGCVDPTPAVVAFTVETALPETELVHEPGYVTGPFVAFEWNGSDRDGVIAGYEYRLLQERGGDWIEIETSGPLSADVTSVAFGPLAGRHRFDVWSVDDAGAVDPTPASKIFHAAAVPDGLVLTVTTNVLGTFTFRGGSWSNDGHLPIAIFAGDHLSFHWRAEAANGFGEVVGFRHALDDTSTWPAWSLDDAGFEIVAEPGRHTLYVGATDEIGHTTTGWVVFEATPAPLDGYILIVDDYDWREEIGGPWGSDADRSEFYDLLVAGCARDRYEWEPDEHIVQGSPRPPGVDALADASTVIWYADRSSPTLEVLFDPWESRYDLLAGYLRAGGNLILCGWEVLGTILSESYPLVVSPSDSTAGSVFVRNHLGIGGADLSGYGMNVMDPWNFGYCFRGAMPDEPGHFEPMYIDSLEKWPLWSDPPPGSVPLAVPGVEALDVYAGTALAPFVIDSWINPDFEGAACAALRLSGDNHGNTFYVGVPLYYLQTEQVRANVTAVLTLFGEERR